MTDIEQIARAIEAKLLGADSGRLPDGRDAPDADERHSYDEGLETAARVVRAWSSPRLVRTPEELEALPDETLVRASGRYAIGGGRLDSYTAFDHWRTAIAKAAGYRAGVDLDWDHISDANIQGEWAETPTDPLLVLLAHSDCDGVIHPEQAGPLADRLAELLPMLLEGSGGGHIGDWREATQEFIDGLRRAVAAGEAVEFR